MTPKRHLEDLRSRRWYADSGMRGFAHRQRMQQMGLRRARVLFSLWLFLSVLSA